MQYKSTFHEQICLFYSNKLNLFIILSIISYIISILFSSIEVTNVITVQAIELTIFVMFVIVGEIAYTHTHTESYKLIVLN
jgi:hypothetical protein